MLAAYIEFAVHLMSNSSIAKAAVAGSDSCSRVEQKEGGAVPAFCEEGLVIESRIYAEYYTEEYHVCLEKGKRKLNRVNDYLLPRLGLALEACTREP
jgi:hypothetical protein